MAGGAPSRDGYNAPVSSAAETRVGVLIVGAGPAGLGAAWRLHQAGREDWLLIEAAAEPGGLARTVADDRGFLWDLGGHVLFSHYPRFDRLMDELLPGGWTEHQRSAWVWMRGRFIPYPLQNNLWRLPEAEAAGCLEGLRRAEQSRPAAPADFHGWLLASFGRELLASFFLPYNRKVWRCEPAELSAGWTAERVAPASWARAAENARLRREDRAWGPNARFRFPRRGGTGAIWRALAVRLPAERLRFGCRLGGVQSGRRRALLAGGGCVDYSEMISTAPLDLLLGMLADRPELAAQGARLGRSGVDVVGVGLAGPVPEALADKCWIYFPEPEAPFYRVTVFSNYAEANVPEPGRQWSLLCEVPAPAGSAADAAASARVRREALAALRALGWAPADAEPVSLWHRRVERAYPTPLLSRDEVLAAVEPELLAAGIRSRGRFGAWKYEVGNMDHALMQGVEAAEAILSGAEEVTVRDPARVNAPRAPDPARRPGRPGKDFGHANNR